ncbi:MAG: hypothetical protein DCF15_11335 [Phormidesmis priestleyi]|uniref:Uncharacterized protein n=1 Tax=Phormidesmis priestleyi TaxID=268141 RepID=A0A2W4XFP1_9CYAN|nr:MAG: hypothetical protein DCF15_11335 [Phormidesmis priestleyi]
MLTKPLILVSKSFLSAQIAKIQPVKSKFSTVAYDRYSDSEKVFERIFLSQANLYISNSLLFQIH